MTVPKSWPDTYEIANFPAGNPPVGTIWLHRTPAGFAEKRSTGEVVPIGLRIVESANLPDENDPNWDIHYQITYDYSKLTGTAKRWDRTPSGWILPSINDWTLAVKLPVEADAKTDPDRSNSKIVQMPQDVQFRFGTRATGDGALEADVTFVAGLFTNISYQLLDNAKVAIAGTTRGQQLTQTDTALGLGWSSVPSDAKYALFEFFYLNGGVVPFTYTIV